MSIDLSNTSNAHDAEKSPKRIIVKKKAGEDPVKAELKNEIHNNDQKIKTSKSFGSSDSFFSGLGFGGTTQTPVQEKEQEPMHVEKVLETPVVVETKKNDEKDDFLAQATTIARNKTGMNAKVVSRSENFSGGARPANKPSHTRSNPPMRGDAKKPSHGGYQKGGFQSKPGGGFQSKGGSNQKRGGFQSQHKTFGASPSFHNHGAKTSSVVVEPRKKEIKEAKISATLQKKTEINIANTITVKELSEKMGVPMHDLLKVMLQNKIIGGVNTTIDFDTASLLATEFSVEVVKNVEQMNVENILLGDLQSILDLDKEAPTTVERPPVVTVMGHVDHGKTSLLDYLRKSNIAGGEAGGITQSIGASMIEYQGKKITFLDTPGHELFTALRARGAKLTNIVIIIVAADDGIMPQTIESINHAKEAGVPIIVAVTKIDKENNNYEKIKKDIGIYGLIPEERGGDVPVLGISSKTGQGIPELLEYINLQAEIMHLQYNPNRNAVGVIVDAHKDAKQGISTSIIILTGTLRVGDIIVAHNTYGKVKRMLNSQFKQIKEAKGGEPVMILGLQEVPEPGRIVEVVDKEKDAQQRVALIERKVADDDKHNALEKFMEQRQMMGEKAVLKLIIKSEGPSSLEALKAALLQIKMPESVELKIIHSGVGLFTDSDLSLGQASDGVLLGFNANIPSPIRKKAEQQHVTIKTFSIIYELIAYVEDVIHGLIEIEQEEYTVGKLKILGVFFKKEKMMVVGGKVIEGKAKNGVKFRLWRNDEEVGTGEVTSLQKDMQSVSTVALGHECGMKVKISKRIEEGDILEFFAFQDKAQS